MKISNIALAIAAAILSVNFVATSANAANERDKTESPSGVDSPFHDPRNGDTGVKKPK